jgi:hypothetical protein
MDYLTTKEHELVMEILMDRLLEFKADNYEEEEIDYLEEVMDKLDNLLIEYGDGEGEEE